MAESESHGSKSFWSTVPGLLTGIAAVITAIGGILAVLLNAGILGSTEPEQISDPPVENGVVDPAGDPDDESEIEEHKETEIIDPPVAEEIEADIALPERGLIAYYSFDGHSDDTSGNDRHGIEHGNTAYVRGIVGQAANFDGRDSWIEVNTGLNFENSFTFSFLILTDSKDASLFEKGESCPNRNSDYKGTSYGISLGPRYLGAYQDEGQGYLNSYVIEQGGNYYDDRILSSSASHISLQNGYHHVAIVFDQKNFTFYIDGTIIESTPFHERGDSKNVSSIQSSDFSSIHRTTSTLKIGAAESYCRGHQMTSWFTGNLDELRIHNEALTRAEIDTLAKRYGLSI